MHTYMGAYLNDVRTEGEGGGLVKRDDSTDRLRELNSDRGEGPKSLKNGLTSF